jgi:hypothetical protein
MKRCRYKICLLAVLSVSAIALFAQTENPFLGKWELNSSKSKFDPPPPLKSETVTVTDTKTTVEGMTADGKSFKWTYGSSNGSPIPIEGREPGATVEVKLSGNVIDHTWKTGTGVSHGHGVVSKDGKTMKYVNTGTDNQGRKIRDVYIFEKQ